MGIAPDIWVCGRKGCDYIRFYDRNKLYVALCSCLLKDENSVYVATPNDKSKKEAIEIINNICDTYVKDQIEYKDDYVIKFTNGSIIRVLSPEKEQDTTRGKKSSQIKFYDTDFLVSNEVLDEVLKPYIKQ